jgi:hypothetical protein
MAIQQAARAAILVAFFSDSSPSPMLSLKRLVGGSWDGRAHLDGEVRDVDPPATPRFPATKIS